MALTVYKDGSISKTIQKQNLKLRILDESFVANSNNDFYIAEFNLNIKTCINSFIKMFYLVL